MAAARPLTNEQCAILDVLVDSDATVADRTFGNLVRRLDIDARELAAQLEEMVARTPPLVRLVPDETWSAQVWFATGAGRRAYQESCGG